MVGASYFFYGAFDWRFIGLLAGSTMFNQMFGVAIHRSRAPGVKRLLLWPAVAGNIGLLGYFKYTEFLLDSGTSILDVFGVEVHPPAVDIVLPLGISFITFQALSYVIDIKRGKLEPGSLVEFAVYLSFFPHVVAGPIVRAAELMPQLREKIDPRKVDVGPAFWLIAAGMFKKVVVASYLADRVVDNLFANPADHGGIEALVGVYAYAIQIFADFSGYTDIAIGLAALVGFRFPQNFNSPYTATSVQDFWRRWHMTLSRWLRDYVYIGLGGNRGGRLRTYRNLMLTMLLGGLWHGAAWTFVVWGALHGGWQAAERWRSSGARHERRGASTVPGVARVGRSARDLPRRLSRVDLLPGRLVRDRVRRDRTDRVPSDLTDADQPRGRRSRRRDAHLAIRPERPRATGAAHARPSSPCVARRRPRRRARHDRCPRPRGRRPVHLLQLLMTTTLPPTPVDKARPKRPAGSALFTVLVSFLAAALLNADGLMHVADQQPIGWQRTAARIAVRPIFLASHGLGLNLPRRYLAEAVGSETLEDVGKDRPSARTGPTTTLAPPPTTIAPRVPTVEDPVKVFLAGDSFLQDVAIGITRLMEEDGRFEVETKSKPATGLSRPEVIDWPLHIRETMPEDTEIIVLSFGGNDAQDMLDGKRAIRLGTPEWAEEYQYRIGQVLDVAAAGGRTVLWLGVPTSDPDNIEKARPVMNGAAQKEIERRPSAHYVETTKALSRDGKFTTNLRIDGEDKRIRRQDGFHVTLTGANLVAELVFEELGGIWPITEGGAASGP